MFVYIFIIKHTSQHASKRMKENTHTKCCYNVGGNVGVQMTMVDKREREKKSWNSTDGFCVASIMTASTVVYRLSSFSAAVTWENQKEKGTSEMHQIIYRINFLPHIVTTHHLSRLTSGKLYSFLIKSDMIPYHSFLIVTLLLLWHWCYYYHLVAFLYFNIDVVTCWEW